MKLNNGSNIITDDNVTITGGKYSGKATLHDVIEKLDNAISKLLSNVKWLYTNGGTGSGYGSGGGTGSGTGDSSFTALFNNKAMTSTPGKLNKIFVDGDGIYKLEVTIKKPNLKEFYVSYEYTPDTGTVKTGGLWLTSTSNYKYTFDIEVVLGNGEIKISVFDQNNNEWLDTLYCYCVSLYYTLASSFSGINGESVLVDNVASLNSVLNYGLLFTLNYSFNVSDIECDYIITFSDKTLSGTEGSKVNSLSGKLNISSPSLKIPLYSINDSYLLSSDNYGAKSLTYTLNIVRTIDGIRTTETVNKLLTFDVIPTGFYVALSSNGGLLYNEKDESLEVINKYSLNAEFIPTIYNGTLNSYDLYYSLYNNANTLIYSGMSTVDRRLASTSFIIALPVTGLTSGWFKLSISVPSENNYTQIYYIYFAEKEDLDYYSLLTNNYRLDHTNLRLFYSTGAITNNGYNDTYKPSAYTSLNSYLNKSTIKIRDKESYTTNIYTGGLSLDNNHKDAFHISFGLKYSSVNNKGSKIITIGDNIIIYQNLIQFALTGVIDASSEDSSATISPREIFIPMDDEYHLISIWRRTIGVDTVTNNRYYETVLYIDGVAESVYLNVDLETLNPSKITLHKGNYNINLLDVAYLALAKNSTILGINNADYTSAISYLTDWNESVYYYAYRKNLFNDSSAELNYTLLSEGLAAFKIDDKLWIEILENFLNQLVLTSGIPTLVLKVSTIDLKSTAYKTLDAFRNYIDEPVKDTSATLTQFNTSVEYYKAKSSEKIDILDLFAFEFQGSTTLGNRSKNFELSIVLPMESDSSEDTIVKLFTPNFDPSNTSTFLPEKSFTLKADVVDSSHSNNTTIGKFINKNTTRFFDKNDNTYKYVKNCLEGFPISLIIKTFDIKEENGQLIILDTHMYYMGIYNFNLGRESYSNLGYYTKSGILTIINETTKTVPNFKVIKINKNDLSVDTEVYVTEVLDGSPYYDFSQWDYNILFGTSKASAMLGKFKYGNSSEEDFKLVLLNLVKNISYCGGYLFDSVKKKFGLQSEKYNRNISVENILPSKFSDTYIESLNLVPNFKELYTINDNGSIVKKTGWFKNDESDALETAKDIWDITPSSGSVLEYINKLNNINTANLKSRIDYNSIVDYYTACMAFGLVDSVEKNMNLKSFDGGKIFKCAFYDMDTCLGRDNNGDEVKYFAFSDFWSEIVDSESLDKIISIYPDYYPDRSLAGSEVPIGYDIPASYMFAIAKYAKSVLGAENSDFTSPTDLWAQWRSNDGPLKDAKTFINDYFLDHLKNVNPSLFNLNYRFKYLRHRTINGHPGALYSESLKLIGRGVERVKDWVNGRFHLLDAYFNVGGYSYSIPYRDTLETTKTVEGNVEVYEGSWKNTDYLYPSPIVRNSAASNTDVLVLHDIFTEEESSTGNAGIRFAGNGTIKFKAKKYTPIIVTTSANATATGGRAIYKRYLVMDEDNYYPISIVTTGNLYFLLGGSSQFTEIENISYFVQNGTLTINAGNLTNLSSSEGYISKYEIGALHSLSKIELNGINLTGTLTFTNGESYPNLFTIDISNSKNNLVIKDSGVESINLKGINSSLISIVDCNALSTLSLNNNTKIDSFTVTPLPDKLAWVFDGEKINKMSLGAKYASLTLSISNMNTLTDLTLGKFYSVSLSNSAINNLAFTEDFGKSCVELTISGTKLDSITPSANGILYFNSLKNLIIRDNYISSIKLHDNEECKAPELKTATFYGANINSIDLTNCSNLQTLKIELGTDKLRELILKGCTNLTTLEINVNSASVTGYELETLDLRDCPNLTSIKITGPKLNKLLLPLLTAENPGLSQIKEIILNCKELVTTVAESVNEEDTQENYIININYPTITSLSLLLDKATNINISNCKLNLEELLLTAKSLQKLTFIDNNVKSLILNSENLENVVIKNVTEEKRLLTKLEVLSKELSTIDISNLKSLEELIFKTNKLSTITGLSNSSKLTTLLIVPIISEYNELTASTTNIYNNALESIVFPASLKNLDLEDSKLSTINLNSGLVLAILYLPNLTSSITSLPTSLKSLINKANNTATWTINNSNLESLEISGLQYGEWRIKNNAKLNSIVINPSKANGNSSILIKDDSEENHNKFTKLDIRGVIGKLYIENNNNLETLLLKNKTVTGFETIIEILNNSNLKNLFLDGCYFTKCLVKDNTSLTTLVNTANTPFQGMSSGILEICSNNIELIEIRLPVLTELRIHDENSLESIKCILRTYTLGYNDPDWYSKCKLNCLTVYNCDSLTSVTVDGKKGKFLDKVLFGTNMPKLEKLDFHDMTSLSVINGLKFTSEEIDGETTISESELENRGLVGLYSNDNDIYYGLKELNLSGTNPITTVFVNPNFATHCTSIDISNSSITTLRAWNDIYEGLELPKVIDLSQYTLVLGEEDSLSFNNSSTEKIQLPCDENKYIKVSSFANSKDLLSITGNIMITGPRAFLGCSSLTLNKNSFAEPANTIYINPELSNPMNVPFESDGTNISFAVSDFTSMFENCNNITMNDIEYILRNCIPYSYDSELLKFTKEDNPTLILDSCFSLTYADRRNDLSLPWYLFHNTKGIKSLNDIFHNRRSKKTEDGGHGDKHASILARTKVASPSNNLNNGFFSPLAKSLKLWKHTKNDHLKGYIVEDEIKIYNNEEYPLTEYYEELIIDKDFFNYYGEDSSIALETIDTTNIAILSGEIGKFDSSLNYSGLLNLTPNLTTLKDITLVGAYYADNSWENEAIKLDYINIPTSVTKINLILQSAAGETHISHTNGHSGLFKMGSLIENLGSILTAESSKNCLIIFDNDSLKAFDKIKTFNTSNTTTLPDELFIGVNKILDTNYENIFVNCPSNNITNISGFFLNIKTSEILNIPGNLFNDSNKFENLIAANYLFWNSKFKYKLTSNGFINTNLIFAKGIFGRDFEEALMVDKSTILGGIPILLFKTKNEEGSLLNLSYAFLALTLDPYENINPTNLLDFDGYNIGELELPDYILNIKSRLEESELIDYSSSISSANDFSDTGTYKYMKIHKGSDLINIPREFKYFCPPDLLLYCNKNNTSLNLEGMFMWCGNKVYNKITSNIEGTTYQEVINCLPGIKGRIPEKLFDGLSYLKGIPSMFKGCRYLSYYDKNNDKYLIPEGLFTGTSISNFDSTFAYMSWPAGVHLNGLFSHINSFNVKQMFYCPTFIEYGSNLVSIGQIFNSNASFIDTYQFFARGYYEIESIRSDTETLYTLSWVNDSLDNNTSVLFSAPPILASVPRTKEIFSGYNTSNLIIGFSTYNIMRPLIEITLLKRYEGQEVADNKIIVNTQSNNYLVNRGTVSGYAEEIIQSTYCDLSGNYLNTRVNPEVITKTEIIL